MTTTPPPETKVQSGTPCESCRMFDHNACEYGGIDGFCCCEDEDVRPLGKDGDKKMPSDKDIVVVARELAPYVQGIADSTGGGKLSYVPELLRALADEVERLRKQAVTMAQDARYDAQAAADEAYWRDKQGDKYGGY